MAASVVGRVPRQALLRVNGAFSSQKVNMSTSKVLSRGKKIGLALFGTVVAAGGAYEALSLNGIKAEGLVPHPPVLPWSHHGNLNSMDMASVRRGYFVYKNVCAACHSMNYMYYRYLVDAIFSESEAKAEAAEAMIIDGPDEAGNMFDRPGKLFDRFPSPYKNDEEAAAANNGAIPPDLTMIVKAREEGEDYIFSLLTGYCDAPAGMELGEGQYYNPYFPGAAISMAKALYNEAIEYDDGTVPTQSQLAKDVVTFLAWAGELEHDKKKLYGMKGFVLFALGSIVAFYYTRHRWSYIKSRGIAVQVGNKVLRYP